MSLDLHYFSGGPRLAALEAHREAMQQAREIRREAIHETADGRKLLVVHGDDFDAVMLAHRWLAVIGDAAYTALMKCNVVVNAVRHKLGLPYWSLSMVAKHRVKNAVQFIGRYEEVVAHAARSRGVDGVVCGHIHRAEMREIGGTLYCNDGDWVESHTALVEHMDGRLELLQWPASPVANISRSESAAVV